MKRFACIAFVVVLSLAYYTQANAGMEGTSWNVFVFRYIDIPGMPFDSSFSCVFRFTGGVFTATGLGSAEYAESEGYGTVWSSIIEQGGDWWWFYGVATGGMIYGVVDSNVGLVFAFYGLPAASATAARGTAATSGWYGK